MSKMEFYNQENPCTMVFQVLRVNKDLFLSVSEIVVELLTDYQYNTTPDTVRKSLAQLQNMNEKVISRVERRGEKRQPMYVYSLTDKI